MPFRVRISHNNTIRTVERSLLAADTDGYANAKSGTVRDCAGKSSGKVYRDTIYFKSIFFFKATRFSLVETSSSDHNW